MTRDTPRWPDLDDRHTTWPDLGKAGTFYLGQQLTLQGRGVQALPVYGDGPNLLVTGQDDPFGRLVLPQTLVSFARGEQCVGVGFVRSESLARLTLALECGRRTAVLAPLQLPPEDEQWLTRLQARFSGLEVYRVDLLTLIQEDLQDKEARLQLMRERLEQVEAGEVPPDKANALFDWPNWQNRPLDAEDAWLSADLTEVIVPASGDVKRDAISFQHLLRHVALRMRLRTPQQVLGHKDQVTTLPLGTVYLHLPIRPAHLGQSMMSMFASLRAYQVQTVVLTDSLAQFTGQDAGYMKAFIANHFAHRLTLLSGLDHRDLQALPGDLPGAAGQDRTDQEAGFGPGSLLRLTQGMNSQVLQAVPLTTSHFPAPPGQPPVAQALFLLHLSAQMRQTQPPAPPARRGVFRRLGR